MEEKELRTSWKQRLLIIIVALIMLGTLVVGYVIAIVNSNSSSSTSADTKISQAKIEEYTLAYQTALDEFATATQGDFDTFIQYKSNITAYNEEAANTGGVQTVDLKEGTGAEVVDGDTNYLAYYVGWCADETIFDSSFDDAKNPQKMAKILDATAGMIEGWNLGVSGMKREGIRMITIPGELAYGESMEICGGKNKPLKFLVYVKSKDQPLLGQYLKLNTAYMRLQYANYGIDYDELMNTSTSESAGETK